MAMVEMRILTQLKAMLELRFDSKDRAEDSDRVKGSGGAKYNEVV